MANYKAIAVNKRDVLFLHPETKQTVTGAVDTHVRCVLRATTPRGPQKLTIDAEHGQLVQLSDRQCEMFAEALASLVETGVLEKVE